MSASKHAEAFLPIHSSSFPTRKSSHPNNHPSSPRSPTFSSRWPFVSRRLRWISFLVLGCIGWIMIRESTLLPSASELMTPTSSTESPQLVCEPSANSNATETPARKSAYVFYASNSNYACSAMIMMHQLRNEHKSTLPFIMMVTPGVPETQWKHAEEYHGAIIKHVSAPAPPPGGRGGYYNEVMTKLLVFKLYEEGWDRLMIMDSDQMVLQSIDHLFDMPPFDVAAPRFSWGDGLEITSTMLLITPSERLWKRIDKKLGALGPSEFDMDVINNEFKQEMLILPARYCTLNSLWETNTLPHWVQSPGSSDAERLTNLYKNEAMVMHFTALGKPWTYTGDSARRLRPNAHPVFAEQFEKWHEQKAIACPT